MGITDYAPKIGTTGARYMVCFDIRQSCVRRISPKTGRLVSLECYLYIPIFARQFFGFVQHTPKLVFAIQSKTKIFASLYTQYNLAVVSM